MIKKPQIRQCLLAVLCCLLIATPLAAQRQQANLDTVIKYVDLKQVSTRFFLNYIQPYCQCGFAYPSEVVEYLPQVTYHASKVRLIDLMDTILTKQGLEYKVFDRIIGLNRKDEWLLNRNKVDILTGRVTDENGKPLAGVSVSDAAAGRFAITSSEGIFKLPWSPGSNMVEFTHVAREKKQVRIKNKDSILQIVLKPAFNTTEEVVIMAYHNVSRRNNTASTDRIQGQELRFGGINVMHALIGKAPGLLITEASGAPGAAVRAQIRGRQSIGTIPGDNNQSVNDPLMLIDKIPFVPGNKPVTLLPSAAGDPQSAGISGGGIAAQPTVNIEDIETIDVLKDADATAIYGSRGAHGAILITTKTGRLGEPAFRFNIQRGAVTSTLVPELLDNKEYTAMRREALRAAGMLPTVNNAPDLFRLDTNDYINIPQLLAGNTGQLINTNGSLQGGDTLLRYYVSTGYYRETSVMPSPLPQQRFTSHAGIRYRSPNRRLQVDASLLYSSLHYNSTASDPLLQSARQVPLLPSLRDAKGDLVWEHNGFHFMNPLGQFQNSSNTRINTFTVSWQGAYKISNDLYLRSTLGYQSLPVKEELILRMAAGYPTGEIATAHNQYRSFIAEPRLEYEHTGNGHWRWGGLLGVTAQQENRQWGVLQKVGYSNDALLGLPDTTITAAGYAYMSTYRYRGIYSRWHMDVGNRYFINATGRLDASSRLGPRGKMTCFGAVGAAWVFSGEKWFRYSGWLTYGKLRTSYGTVGNDNISDDIYYRTGILQPADNEILPLKQQINPALTWEKSRKLEVAMELEAFRSLFLTMAWYRNVTTDQLITTNIAGQNGLTLNHISNWPAKVLNTGWEFSLRATARWGPKVNYTSMLQVTLPRNRLLAFPGIEATPYNNILIIGQPLSALQGYRFSGVDPYTGLYKIPESRELVIAGHLEPRAYAGWSHEWRWGSFQISVFLEGRLQQAMNPLYYSSMAPGRWSPTQLTNQPRALLQRWRQPGDQVSIQRVTAANTVAVQQAMQFFRASDAMLVDASFARIRSLYLGWELPVDWSRRIGLIEARLYLQAQNLFTATPYRDGDPTIQYPTKLPSLRTITAGLQISL